MVSSPDRIGGEPAGRTNLLTDLYLALPADLLTSVDRLESAGKKTKFFY